MPDVFLTISHAGNILTGEFEEWMGDEDALRANYHEHHRLVIFLATRLERALIRGYSTEFGVVSLEVLCVLLFLKPHPRSSKNPQILD